MMSAEEIIKSLQAEMTAYENEYAQIEKEIKETSVNYNDMMSKLLTKKEQIRGSYTALYNQVQKLVGEPEKHETAEPDVEDAPASVKEQAHEVNEEPVETSLSAEEIAKITKLTKAPSKVKQPDVADVPEYLKEEYGVE